MSTGCSLKRRKLKKRGNGQNIKEKGLGKEIEKLKKTRRCKFRV